MQIILDTGPWVALHSKNDTYHEWAKQQFSQFQPPFITCEAVMAETCHILKRGGFNPSLALSLVERGVVNSGLSLDKEISRIKKLFDKYKDVPASLADISLVRLSEIYPDSCILTLDSDFNIYRRNGRQVIPLITP